MTFSNKAPDEDSAKVNPSFKPKFIDDAKTIFYKEDERGKFYLISNPQNKRSFKINAMAYDVIQMLDGNNSLGEIEEKTREKGIALNVYRFSKFLAMRGFIENLKIASVPRTQPLDTVKYPLINANSRRILKFYRIHTLAFSKPFLVFCIPFCGVALSLFLLNFSMIIRDATQIFYPNTSVANLVATLILFLVVEFSHELSHAATYYNIGGTPQAIGFCYHFMIPFMYNDISDTYLFPFKKTVKVFLAGPLSTVFFGSLFVTLYFSGTTLRNAWAMLSFACFFSALFTLMPFVKTDGYYVLESLLKFPNFHTHALRNICNTAKYTLGFLSPEKYNRFRSRYSSRERRILDIYCTFLPFGIIAMIYISVFMVLQVAIPSVLVMISQLMAIPEAATPNAYVFLLMLVSSIILILYGILISILNLIKRRRGKGSVRL